LTATEMFIEVPILELTSTDSCRSRSYAVAIEDIESFLER